MRHYFLREKVFHEEIIIEPIKVEDQVTDIFTKRFTSQIHRLKKMSRDEETRGLAKGMLGVSTNALKVRINFDSFNSLKNLTNINFEES